MFDSITLTLPTTNGSYVKVDVFVAHITAMHPTIAGEDAGLTTIHLAGSPKCMVEETITQVQAKIDAVRKRQHVSSQGRPKVPWWALGQRR